MPDFATASAAQLLRETLDGLLPPVPISTARWAAENRWVKSPAGIQLRRWDPRTNPPLEAIMEALDDEALSTVAVVGPAGSGKTMAAENWLLKTVDTDPAAFLWYGPTDPIVDSYVKDRIEPMLEAHEPILGAKRAGLGRDSVNYKRFRGMTAQFLTFTASNLTNKHVARIVADEVDAYTDALGDPQAVLNYRRRAAGAGSMLLLISHPDQATGLNPRTDWQQGIMAAYRDSDRRTWWWPCPDCGEYSSPNPGTAHHMALDYPEDAPLAAVAARTVLVCPHCGATHGEDARRHMLQRGRWLCEGQEIAADGTVTGQRAASSTAGFWLVGAMNPFLPEGIGSLAIEREKARRNAEISGDDKALKQVMVKGWGIPYQPPRQVGTIEATVIADRATEALQLGVLPDWARCVTTAVDNQANRFELLSRAWGADGQSAVVDFRVIPAEPATSPEDWDALMALLAGLAYPTGDGRAMRVRCATFGVVGQPGVTEQAYAAWRRARAARQARLLGKVRGRDAWNILPARGASAPGAQRVAVSYPEGARRDRKASAKGEVPVLLFNPNQAKDALAAQLAREDGPGSIGFPAALRTDGGPPHLWFEQLAAERRDIRGRWTKIRDSLRNEAWDLLVMAEVAARLHGIHRINWASPPAWAAPWDASTMLRPVADATTPAPAAAAPVVPVARPAGGGLTQPPPAPLPAGVAIVQAVSLGARLAARLP